MAHDLELEAGEDDFDFQDGEIIYAKDKIYLSMEFAPGDMQFLHNHQILHSRTDYEDWPDVEERRHLLRLWLAPESGRPLPPVFEPRYGKLTPGNRGGIFTESTKLTFSVSPV